MFSHSSADSSSSLPSPVYPLLVSCVGFFPDIPFYTIPLRDSSSSSSSSSPDSSPLTPTPYFSIDTSSVSDVNVRIVRVSGLTLRDVNPFVVSSGSSPFHSFLYDMHSQRLLVKYVGHQHDIWGLATISIPTLGSSGSRLISGDLGIGAKILVFDTMAGICVGEIEGGPRFTYRILAVPEWNPSEVFAAGLDEEDLGCVCRFDLERSCAPGECRGRYEGHTNDVRGLDVGVERGMLFSASEDRNVLIWDKDNYASSIGSLALSEWGFSCCCAEEKNLLVVGMESGGCEVWDLRKTSQRLRKILPTASFVDDIAWIEGTDFFVSGEKRGFSAWNIDGKVLLQASFTYVRGVCVFPESSRDCSKSCYSVEAEPTELLSEVSDLRSEVARLQEALLTQQTQLDELRCQHAEEIASKDAEIERLQQTLEKSE